MGFEAYSLLIQHWTRERLIGPFRRQRNRWL